MCWFVTIGVAGQGAPILEELGSQRGGLVIRRSVNPHVARIFPKNDIPLEITHGGCSCDLYSSPRQVNPSEQERLRQKYEKKGWSEAKIARAMGAKEAAKSVSVGRTREMGPECWFREAITAQVRRFHDVRVFAHMYNGSVDDEVVTSEGHCRIDLSQFLESGFPAEKLVEIVEGA